MATTIVNTQIKLKRGTAARWEKVNPVLAQGEPGFVYDTNQMKIGDGIRNWNDLPFINDDSSDSPSNIDELVNIVQMHSNQIQTLSKNMDAIQDAALTLILDCGGAE